MKLKTELPSKKWRKVMYPLSEPGFWQPQKTKILQVISNHLMKFDKCSAMEVNHENGPTHQLQLSNVGNKTIGWHSMNYWLVFVGILTMAYEIICNNWAEKKIPSGQTISPTWIFLKYGEFPSLATFWGPRSCEVAIFWPDPIYTTQIARVNWSLLTQPTNHEIKA